MLTVKVIHLTIFAACAIQMNIAAVMEKNDVSAMDLSAAGMMMEIASTMMLCKMYTI